MSKDSKFCPECGSQHKKSDKFCIQCGKKFLEVEKGTKGVRQDKKIGSDFYGRLDMNGKIGPLLAKKPFPIIVSSIEYITFMKKELDIDAKKSGMGDIHNFMQVGSSLSDFLTHHMQHFNKIKRDIVSQNTSEEAKNLADFMNNYSSLLMRETKQSSMMRQPVSFGSEDYYEQFIAIIIYFIQKYPALIVRETFENTEETDKETLINIAESLDSILYRLNKDINIENEVVPDYEKYPVYNFQKFLIGVSLKLPIDNSRSEEAFDSYVRKAFQLHRYHILRSEIDLQTVGLESSQIIPVAENTKSIEILLDLNEELRILRNKHMDRSISALVESFETLVKNMLPKQYYTKRNHQLLLRWIEDTIEYLENMTNFTDEEVTLILEIFFILNAVSMRGAMTDVNFTDINSIIYEKSLQLFREFFAPNLLKIYRCLDADIGKIGITIMFLTSYFKDDIQALKDEMDALLNLYEDMPAMHFKVGVMVGNSLKISIEYNKNENLMQIVHHLYNSIAKLEIDHSVEKQILLNTVEKFNFKAGTVPLDKQCVKIHAILADTEISPEKSISFSTVNANTPDHSVSISESNLSSILDKLPYMGKKNGRLNYDMAKQYIIMGSIPLYAILTKDKEGKTDGLLFTFELDEAEAESFHSISYPGGSREGVKKKISITTLKSVHLFGFADTDGPLSTGEISLAKYLERIETEEHFKNAKRYYLGVKTKTEMPLFSSLIK